MSETPEGKGPSSYLSRAAVLVGASIVSQGVAFASTLFVARLYAPVDVGILGLFNAILNFASLAASWRYEFAIVTVDQQRDADDVTVFVVVAGAISALVGTAIVLLISTYPASIGLSDDFRSAIWLLPLSLMFISFVVSGTNVCLRKGQFNTIAGQQIAMAVVTAIAQISLSKVDLSPGGLVVGFVVGQASAAAVLSPWVFPTITESLRRPNLLRRLRRVAYENRGYFYYTNPYTLVSTLYLQAPVFVLSAVFDARTVGMFNMAYRTIYAPFGLMPIAISQAFFSDLARERNRLQGWGTRLQNVLLASGVLMAGAAAVVVALGPNLYAFLLGPVWRDAGVFAQIIVVPALMMALAAGSDRLYFVLDRQRAALLVISGMSVLSAGAMFAALRMAGTPIWMIGGWAAVHLVFSALWIGVIYRFAGFSLSGLYARWLTVLVIVGILASVLSLWPKILEGSFMSLTLAGVAGGIYLYGAIRAALSLSRMLRMSKKVEVINVP